MPVYVIKANGEKELFDPAKLKRTLLRAGASQVHAEEIIKDADRFVFDGMTTKELLKKVLGGLRSVPVIAGRYDLKGALLRLGPTGFTFEQFMARVLQEYGYATQTDQILAGKCVKHEVDILAAKGKKTTFVECKYHNAPGIYTDLHVAMYTWARFIDLKEGKEKVDEGLLITNTKFSMDAMDFGICRGLRMMGWNFPKGEGLQDRIEKKDLWPITVLKVDKFLIEQLSSNRLLLVKDIAKMNPEALAKKAKIPRPKADALVTQAKSFL